MTFILYDQATGKPPSGIGRPRAGILKRIGQGGKLWYHSPQPHNGKPDQGFEET